MDLLIHEKPYRSENLLKKISNTQITLCGVGAIGSNLCDNLARQGFQKLVVIDKDRIEPHNNGTQIWHTQEKGLLKCTIMKSRIFSATGTIITDYSKELTCNNIKKFFIRSKIIIDSFDNSESRQLVYDYCKAANMDCLHIGLFEDYAEVIWNEFYSVPKTTKALDVCEYPLARNIVLLAVTVASEVIIKYIETDIKKNYTITLKDLQINEFYP